VVNYLFDSMGTVLKDRSGNGHDGVLHDTKFSADYPDLSCIFHSSQIYKMIKPITIGEHGQVSIGCSDCSKGNGAEVDAQQPPVDVSLHKDMSNPVIIPGVVTEKGSDSVAVCLRTTLPPPPVHTQYQVPKFPTSC
jgi:hypothetical protein